MIASFLQMLEKLTLLKNSHAVLTCNINSVFSCSNVLNAWQSSVFGFPNSLMCIIFFTLTLGVALAGLTGGKLAPRLRLSMQGFALFFVCFALWFFEQSIFVVHAICIFCLFCFAGLLAINFAWLRLNAAELPIGKGGRSRLARGIEKGADILGWFLLAALIAFSMLLKFH